MGKKRKNLKKTRILELDIYKAADTATYALGVATYISMLYSDKLSLPATSMIALSSLLSLVGASSHNSSIVKNCDQAIKRTNFTYGNVTINEATIGSTYGIINSATKGFVGFAFTTALTPAISEIITSIIPTESTYLAPAAALACSAAIGSTMTYVFNRLETDYFNIPNNEFKVGAAGAAQQRFLERLIFNGVNTMIPWGWGYTASAAAGLSSVILSKAYELVGLDTVIHKGQNFFKNPALGFACNAASHIGKMALESWYSQAR
jgi:hypothetical protein